MVYPFVNGDKAVYHYNNRKYDTEIMTAMLFIDKSNFLHYSAIYPETLLGSQEIMADLREILYNGTGQRPLFFSVLYGACTGKGQKSDFLCNR